MSSNGSIVAIGSSNNGNNRGHVRVYEWNNSVWTQLGNDIDGEQLNDGSGSAVSLSANGSRLAIGAGSNNGNGSNSGHVRVYRWDGSAWTQLGDDIDGDGPLNLFGRSVSLSSAGDRLAVGADFTNGINGIESGRVKLFSWNGITWAQLGDNIDGEAAEDHSGISVSLSSDGSRVAIGASENDGNGNAAGHVRVFEGFISCSCSSIEDDDKDTRIHVEENTDEDIIRFYLGDTDDNSHERMRTIRK